MEEKKSILAIEWPEKMGKFLPEKRYDISFLSGSEDERIIKIIKKG
jgi:tRNA A37 threonylcarbamoyladenosine biosynthesis protein TsaE